MALPSATLLAQAILAGLFTGALYGLLGLGLSLSWGMLRQINLAHFALAFLGAYLTYELSSRRGVLLTEHNHFHHVTLQQPHSAERPSLSDLLRDTSQLTGSR